MPYGIQIARKNGDFIDTTVPGDLPAVGTTVEVSTLVEIITARITRHPKKPGMPAQAKEDRRIV